MRTEDPPLLVGDKKFVADLDDGDIGRSIDLHLAFVRADQAHAEIADIGVTEALALPGVVAVETADSLPMAPFRLFDALPAAMTRYPLASGRVRSVGEALAVVVATSETAAADAIDYVSLELKPLPSVLLGSGSEELLYPDAGTNVVHTLASDDPDPIDGADVVVELSVVNQRIGSVPIECDGIVVSPTKDGLDIWCTSQGVQGIREQLAQQLDLPRAALRVRSPAVGGGFGGRATIVPEFVVAAQIAMRHGQTVRWLQSRYENLTGQAQGRGYVTNLRLGVTAEGQITGLDVDVLADAGAEAHMSGLLLVSARRQTPGIYDVPRFRWNGTAHLTNTTPIGAYRGAGQPEANHARERLLDLAAQRLGLDPVELRRRNLPTSDSFPVDTAAGVTYAEGDPIGAMDTALDLANVGRWRALQTERRAVGATRELGIGMANYAQTSGRGEPMDSVLIRLNADGTVLLACASPSHGQGHLTTWSQIVADQLGIDPAAIEMVDSDTDLIATGQTTGGSRSTQVVASALVNTCHDIIEAARPEAAARLEAAEADLVVVSAAYGLGAGLAVAGVPTQRVTWTELAESSSNHCLDAARSESTPGEANPYGTHVSVVEVDTDTGAVKLLAHVAVDDCGRVLQPTLVEGQQHGGSVAGISQALFEEAAYDENANPLSATLATYLLPSAAELCSITTATMGIETERNQLGTRGIGENGCNGATAAVHNAVIDALALRGVEHVDLPLSPQRLWSALNPAD